MAKKGGGGGIRAESSLPLAPGAAPAAGGTAGLEGLPGYDPGTGAGPAAAPPEPPEQMGAAAAQDDSQAVTMYTAEGKAVQVPARQAGALYGAGQLGFAKDQTIHVRDQGGHVFEANPHQAMQALQSGYGIATDADVSAAKERKEYSGIGKTAEAFGSGVASGLTFGLSDLAIAKAGGREELEKLQKYHNIARAAGTITGAVAPVLLSGGLGAGAEAAEGASAAAGLAGAGEAAAGAAEAANVARGAGLAQRTIGALGIMPRAVAGIGDVVGEGVGRIVGEGATGLLGRVAQRAIPLAAQGATEGAFYGMGGEISEAALGDHELNAEKLLAAAGHGAKLGAIGGLIMGGGEVLGKAAIDKGFQLAGKTGLSDWLESFANQRMFKAAGGDRSIYQGLGRTAEERASAVEEIGSTLRNYRFEDGERLMKPTTSVAEVEEGTRRAIEEQTGKLKSINEEAARVIGEKPELGPDAVGTVKKVYDEVINKLRGPNAIATDERVANTLEKEIAPLIKRTTPPGLNPEEHGELYNIWKEAQGGSEQAQKMMEAAKVQHPEIAELIEPKPVPIGDMIDTVKRLDNAIYRAKASGGPAGVPMREDLKELSRIRGIINEEVVSATERAAAASDKPELLAAVRDTKSELHNLLTANEMAQKWVSRDIGNRMFSPSDYGTGGSVLAGMIAAGHGGPASMLAAGGTALVHNFIRERGSAITAAVADRLAMLSKIREATIEVDGRIQKGVNEFLGTTGATPEEPPPKVVPKGAASKAVRNVAESDLGSVGQGAKSLADRLFEKGAENYGGGQPGGNDTLANRGVSHVERVAKAIEPIAPHAPETAANVAARATAIIGSLKQKMPGQQMKEGALQPQFDRPRVSATEKAKYDRYVEGATNPLSIFDKMKSSQLSPEFVQGVKQNYPNMWPMIQSKVMETVSALDKPVPYSKLIQLGIMFETPTHPTLAPEFRASIKKMYDESAAAQQKSDAQTKARAQGARRPAKELASGSALPAQEIQDHMG